jgi:3-deoxy-manno-octulosonate cytidylyltransferase (CMP-KDO synthetase)
MVTAVIPARLGSTRLPDKLLLDKTGKPLIAHTVARANQCDKISRIYVATDDYKIKEVVDGLSTNKPLSCVMTPELQNGTERVKYLCEQFPYLSKGCIVNWQADEPEAPADSVSDLIDVAQNMNNSKICTLATSHMTDSQFIDPNNVKVVVENPHDIVSNALYFSRSPIPYAVKHGVERGVRLIHIGIYVFQPNVLLNLPSRKSSYSNCENLEQLSWMERDKIKVLRVRSPAGGIDTLQDYQNFVTRQAARK